MPLAWVCPPDDSLNTQSVTIEIPSGPLLRAALLGAIIPLTIAENWESVADYSLLTPDECAAAFADVLDSLIGAIPDD